MERRESFRNDAAAKGAGPISRIMTIVPPPPAGPRAQPAVARYVGATTEAEDVGAEETSVVARRTLPWVIADVRDGERRGPRRVENIDAALDAVRAVDGFLAAALVDGRTGEILGSHEGGGIDLQVAATGNSEVVRAKRRVCASLDLRDEIEDILFSYDAQLHLIRPLRGRPSVFFYVVIDRSGACLAMARLLLADAESLLLF